MHALAAAAAGFLVAVLWFDLMFDVQVRARRQAELPAAVRDSIAAYYRRVTTAARPMNRLIAAVMLITIAALVGEIAQGEVPAWIAWASLALTAFAVGLAVGRTVRNAVRLGTQADSPERQSELARAIWRDHLACIVAVSAVLLLQIAGVSLS